MSLFAFFCLLRYLYVSDCLSIHPYIYLSISPFVCKPIFPSIYTTYDYLSVMHSLSVCLSICPSAFSISFFLSCCLTFMSPFVSLCPSIQSVRLSICPFAPSIFTLSIYYQGYTNWQNIQPSILDNPKKNLPGSNTPAYFVGASVTKKKVLWHWYQEPILWTNCGVNFLTLVCILYRLIEFLKMF
jgi:hypothetical protein